MADPWDQLPDETKTQYVHFLTYRDLGPLRSIKKTYRRVLKHLDADKRGGEVEVPGSFWETATRNRWKERADAWDVRGLLSYGNRVAPLYVLMLERMARKGAVAAAEHKPGDKAWGHVLETADTLGRLLEPARKAGAVGDPSEAARADAERAAAAVKDAPLRAEPATDAERVAAVA